MEESSKLVIFFFFLLSIFPSRREPSVWNIQYVRELSPLILASPLLRYFSSVCACAKSLIRNGTWECCSLCHAGFRYSFRGKTDQSRQADKLGLLSWPWQQAWHYQENYTAVLKCLGPVMKHYNPKRRYFFFFMLNHLIRRREQGQFKLSTWPHDCIVV